MNNFAKKRDSPYTNLFLGRYKSADSMITNSDYEQGSSGSDLGKRPSKLPEKLRQSASNSRVDKEIYRPRTGSKPFKEGI
jgi:hypothetical protein